MHLVWQFTGQIGVATDGINCMPTHKALDSEDECRKSGCGLYSSERKYLVQTDEQARTLAEFIAGDNSECLFNQAGHNLKCSCDKERHLLAQALAVFLLRKERGEICVI